MKRICLLISVLVVAIVTNAQHLPASFFDAKGNVRIETQELDDASDTLVSVFHRGDDIVWYKIIYRVIDMRYKQNFQLYYPVHTSHERYHNLLNVIANAVIEGYNSEKNPMRIYSTEFNLNNHRINPDYSDSSLVPYTGIPTYFRDYNINEAAYLNTGLGDTDENEEEDYYEEDYTENEDETQQVGAGSILYDVTQSPAYLIWCKDANDPKAGFVPNFKDFESVQRNQLKYLIQEVVFFDKHTSRLYSKIIGLAPLHADKIKIAEPETKQEFADAFFQSIMFWVSYDDLRPYLARQYMIPYDNDAKRVTFEEFFQKKLYSSYIVGWSDMYDRMILNYATTEQEVQKEQDRIATSLLTFEQDLWEY